MIPPKFSPFIFSVLIIFSIVFFYASSAHAQTESSLQLASILDSLKSILSTLKSFYLLSTKDYSLSSNQLASLTGPDSGLIGYYTFDEGSGTTVNDSSGKSNTGTLITGTSTPQWTTDAKVGGGALSFDGVDDYVKISANPSGIDTSAASACAWINPTVKTAGHAYIVSDTKFEFPYDNVSVTNGLAFTGNNGSVAISASNAITPKIWQYVCVTRDASGIANFYINGVLSGTPNQNSGTPTVSIFPLNIGAYGTGALVFFGLIDDVRIYSRPLSSDEISQLYALGNSGGVSPVNGSCGTTVNSCTTGTLQDITDSSSQYLWNCTGSNNGTTASCSLPISSQSDTTPPTISTIQSTSITQTQATITWQTDEPSDSQIDYGLTTSYGSQTTLNSQLVTSHSQQISNLQANTTYHYRVRSKDGSGNSAQSGDHIVTTAAAVGYISCGTDCYQANTVSVADVQAAIDASQAANGGTVIIPAGTATFTSQVIKTITKDLVVTGAGQDKTIINDNYPTSSIFVFKADGNTFFHLKSMRINQAFTGNMTFGGVFVYGTSFKKMVSDIYFDQTGETGGRILILDEPNHDVTEGGGVIFGNTFYHPGISGQGMSILGSYHGVNDVSPGAMHWDNMPDWGSPNKWYIEDNTFNFIGGEGDGAFDAYDGGRLVFRYNTVIGTSVGWHGFDSSYSSFHSAEIYKNTFTWPQNLLPNHPAFSVNVRGGTALIWDNIYSATYPSAFTISYYRASPNTVYYGAKGRCDGGHPQPWDGNSDPSGYPCWQQPGMTGVNGLTPSPVIQWGNTQNGKDMTIALNSNWIPPVQTDFPTGLDHVKEGRDFLNDTTCSDGINHIGTGINMANPVCAQFWDPVNHMAKGYTPYTYPHPLRSNPNAIFVYTPVIPPAPPQVIPPPQTITYAPPSSGGGGSSYTSPSSGGGGSQSPQTSSLLPLVQSYTPQTLMNQQPLSSHTPTSTQPTPPYQFSRTLHLGDRGDDVKRLQQFLNTYQPPTTNQQLVANFKVALSGPGSQGNETSYYGPATAKAISKLQEFYRSDILSPSGFSHGTGIFGPATLKKVNALLQSQGGAATDKSDQQLTIQKLQAQLQMLLNQLKMLQGR